MAGQAFADVIQAFGDAAARARAAGFQAVEIHAAHGFLLGQFLSPLTNRRDDESGGPVENRYRLHLAVLAEVLARVAAGCAVFVRLGAHDETPGGLELDDACRAATALAAAGAALIDVSGGLQGSRGVGRGAAYFVPYAQRIKAAVDVPVMVTGGIGDSGPRRQGRARRVGGPRRGRPRDAERPQLGREGHRPPVEDAGQELAEEPGNNLPAASSSGPRPPGSLDQGALPAWSQIVTLQSGREPPTKLGRNGSN